MADLRQPVFTTPGNLLAVAPADLVPAGTTFRDVQPMAGRFEVDGDALYFVPRFPFRDRLAYVFLISPLIGGRLVTWILERPASEAVPATTTVEIFPAAALVPVNLLKVYLQFSAPMSEGQAARNVRALRADTGETLDHVFLELDPELWDPERRRLTLLLEPGRIKRGLGPHEEAGYPLVEGVPVTVRVDRGFRDAAGQPLAAGADRVFQVGPALRRRIDPGLWSVDAPEPSTRNELTVTLDRPLDRALLEHCLSVVDSANRLITGESLVGPGETSWHFRPNQPWPGSGCRVVIDPRLEDLAGNSVIRVFDRDLTRRDDDPIAVAKVDIPIRSGA